MARAAKKKQRDLPPLYMTVADGGRLEPGFQHDQERLMSFRRGTRLVVTIEPDGSRRGVRKWFAILGKAVKNSLLPWVTVSAADEAIRLALDLFEPKRANDGSWHRVTQSLNDLSDEELDEQIEAMTALIVKYSGVDPDDFKRELAGAGDERFKSEYDRPAAANDAGSPNDSPDASALSSGEVLTDSPMGQDDSGASLPSQDAGAADLNSAEATKPAIPPDAEVDSDGDPASNSASIATNSAQGTTPETGADADSGRADALATTDGTVAPESSGEEEKAAGEGYGAVSPPAAELSTEDRQWLVDGARMMRAAQPEPSAEAKDVLFRQVKAIIMIMPKSASAEARNRMEQIKQHCMGVCRGEWELDLPMVARAALSTVEATTPAPVTMGRKAR